MDLQEAQELLVGLAEEALSGRTGEVVCLEAPEWPPLPAALRRQLDGRSIYTRPGVARYATAAQLSMEDKLVAHAQTQGAPRLPGELAARRLGADLTQLRAELAGRARAVGEHGAPRGLRLDQAAAAWHALTSARTAEVITGPAGTGKTTVLAALARAWDGPVVGTATSQNATNGLRHAGIRHAASTTRLLTDLAAERIPPGSLIVADEASMISLTHLAAITEYAARNRCKLILAGDQEQLAAVEGGGAMTLLADRLGYVQLAEPVRFTGQVFCYRDYRCADLAYAITGHAAQGGTVHTGIALVTGTEDRQWLYPAMTRGTDMNLAFVFTTPTQVADPRPGTEPAPELDRYDRLRLERQELTPARQTQGEGSPGQREPIAVLADVLSRDGAELSATQTRQQNLADADHLAVLHAIWTAETQAARHDRYRDLVMAALPPGYRQPLSPQARWLFRTLQAAELAGLDPAEVTRTAITSRSLAGARDVTSVLHARIRQRVDPLVPRPQGSWADRVPDLPDAGRQTYLAEIAAMMDDRTCRLGQHTALTAPAWAVKALGPVPADPVARLTWENIAAPIAAYRETYGYDHPDEPIGPEPSREAPNRRAAWHQAFAVLGPADGPDVRAMPDGQLWLTRDTYAAETAWAPPHTGKELRLARLGAADLGAIRAAAEADAARKTGNHDRAVRQENLAASYQALANLYQQRETILAQTMADRQEWDHATAGSRRLAIAADAELRRRHPTRKSGRCAPASSRR
jgi:AAA domain